VTLERGGYVEETWRSVETLGRPVLEALGALSPPPPPPPPPPPAAVDAGWALSRASKTALAVGCSISAAFLLHRHRRSLRQLARQVRAVRGEQRARARASRAACALAPACASRN